MGTKLNNNQVNEAINNTLKFYSSYALVTSEPACLNWHNLV